LTAIALNTFFNFFGWVKRHYRQIEYASAALLIVLGLMVMTNQFTRLASYFNYAY
jgi:cytochrome c biogenesis protein CcdA